ncbi:MAG: hypothetical protein MZV65_29420 [Chromatiales bacterium]|nr:hypothetical protein [Chromatiales bacterium]
MRLAFPRFATPMLVTAALGAMPAPPRRAARFLAKGGIDVSGRRHPAARPGGEHSRRQQRRDRGLRLGGTPPERRHLRHRVPDLPQLIHAGRGRRGQDPGAAVPRQEVLHRGRPVPSVLRRRPRPRPDRRQRHAAAASSSATRNSPWC